MNVDQLRAELEAAAGPEESPSDELVGRFLRRQRTRRMWRRIASASAVCAVAAIIVGAALVGTGDDTEPLAVQSSTATTHHVRDDAATASLVLPGTSFPAGSTVQALLTIRNPTGADVTWSGCGNPVQVELAGRKAIWTSPDTSAFACLTKVSFPPGSSTFPIVIDTRYAGCINAGEPADIRGVRCLADGSPSPLPTGRYTVRVAMPGAPGIEVPAVRKVRLTSPKTSRPSRTDIPVATLELATRVFRAGSRSTAIVTVDNGTGAPFSGSGDCSGLSFAIRFANDSTQQHGVLSCGGNSPIPRGLSFIPVPIDTRYSPACSVDAPSHCTGNDLVPLPEGRLGSPGTELEFAL